MVYGLLALQSGILDSEVVFDLVAVTIALSIVLHSSPDNLPCGQPDEGRDRQQQTTTGAADEPAHG